MHTLIIKAHPNPQGFTHQIVARYVEIKQSLGDEVTVIDVNDLLRRQDFLQLSETNRPEPDLLRDQMQQLIKKADELVFVSPMRWFDAPAVIKNWFDTNMTAQFAYRHRKGSFLPQKLLKGKTARIIFTAGGPTRIMRLVTLGTWLSRALGRLGFVGIWLTSYTIFGDMGELRSVGQRELMLDHVENLARGKAWKILSWVSRLFSR